MDKTQRVVTGIGYLLLGALLVGGPAFLWIKKSPTHLWVIGMPLWIVGYCLWLDISKLKSEPIKYLIIPAVVHALAPMIISLAVGKKLFLTLWVDLWFSYVYSLASHS